MTPKKRKMKGTALKEEEKPEIAIDFPEEESILTVVEDGMKKNIDRIKSQDGVIGYILRNSKSASIDLKDPAKIIDYATVKGSIVLMPYGYAIWEIIQSIFDKELKNIKHRNAYFPTLIPETLLKKEAEHFKGFIPEVFWVTHSGETELSEKLAVRPTSETVIYESFSHSRVT